MTRPYILYHALWTWAHNRLIESLALLQDAFDVPHIHLRFSLGSCIPGIGGVVVAPDYGHRNTIDVLPIRKTHSHIKSVLIGRDPLASDLGQSRAELIEEGRDRLVDEYGSHGSSLIVSLRLHEHPLSNRARVRWASLISEVSQAVRRLLAVIHVAGWPRIRSSTVVVKTHHT